MSEMAENQHNDMLDNIIAASEKSDFRVAEDIYDQSNNKLIAKGYIVSSQIRERLFDRVLRKPIETCIQSDNVITSKEVAETASALFESNALLKVISINDQEEVKALADLKLEPLAAMLLTVLRDGETNKLDHTLLVTLIARTIAKNLKLSQKDITNLTIASLLHDVGELYASEPGSDTLTKENWRRIMAHPLVGSSVVKLYMHYPTAVSTAILEHHERCDGTGYPRKINADNCSLIGQILILSEAIEGILKPGAKTQNVIVAFKLASGVYPSVPLDAFSSMLKTLMYVDSEYDKNATIERLKSSMKALEAVLKSLDDFLGKSETPLLIEENAQHLKYRVEKLKQVIYSSGVQYYLEDNSWLSGDDSQIISLELEISTNEIGWQAQDMLRDLTLRLVSYEHDLPEPFSLITEQLAQVSTRKKTN